MVHARCFLEEPSAKRAEMYYVNTAPGDSPLIAQVRVWVYVVISKAAAAAAAAFYPPIHPTPTHQMCGNDPATLLTAAHELTRLPGIAAIDFNLGCPQGIAKRGRYGAFLLEETELLVRIVSTLARGPNAIACPVTCKIRLLPSIEDTLALCHALVGAGCSLLTVHGRTREQNKHTVGECDWGKIKIIREVR
jgi:tRNA-dihydrouridine synthase